MKSTPIKTYPVSVNVNGVNYSVEVSIRETLLDLLRNRLSLTSVKRTCDNTAQCGACTVIFDGKAVNSCLVLAVEADGKDILTVEGLSADGNLHPIQRAFLEHGALQCGFCTPGIIMSALALLNENANPSVGDIEEALQGNLCRCTGYVKIVEAIKAVANANPGS